MSLEKDGYHYALYNGKEYLIWSEPNYEDFTIELLGYYPFTVSLFDITLIKKTFS